MVRNKPRDRTMKKAPLVKMEIEEPSETDVKPASVESVPSFDGSLLTCEVCLEILYTPINCSPCNHKFCASCIYRWLDLHFTCPKCRHLIKEATKDLFTSQICDEYYRTNPDKARKEQTKDEQDRIELEYIEKLIERARSNPRAFALADSEMDQMTAEEFEEHLRHFVNDYDFDEDDEPARPAQRRLLMSCSRRFREKEWEQRAQRLREKFNLPPRRQPTPVPENDADRGRHRLMPPLDFMRFILPDDYPFGSDSSDDDDVRRNIPRLPLRGGNLVVQMVGRRRRNDRNVPGRNNRNANANAPAPAPAAARDEGVAVANIPVMRPMQRLGALGARLARRTNGRPEEEERRRAEAAPPAAAPRAAAGRRRGAAAAAAPPQPNNRRMPYNLRARR